VEGASVLLAYEHSGEWDDVAKSFRSWWSDGNGVTAIHTFGDSRIRVIAEKFVDGEYDKRKMPLPRHSAVVELETTNLPQTLDVTITFSPLRSPP
jgi:hypothetical protein